MTQLYGVERRMNMFKIFAQFYVEMLTGKGYPRSIDRFFAFMTEFEKQTLFRLARSLPNGSQLVEIGSYLGGSSCCLAAGLADKHSTLDCVDTFMSDAISGSTQENTLARFQHNTRPYADSIQTHRGYSHEVARDFLSASIDLLFIDGDHSWEGVTTDLRLYVPLMKENAILIMQDSAHPPVQKAIHEIILPAESQQLANLPNMYAARISVRQARLP